MKKVSLRNGGIFIASRVTEKWGFFIATTLLIVVCIIESSSTATAGVVDPNRSIQRRNKAWQRKHGKVYGNREEEEKRLRIHKSNVEFIESVNSQNLSYKLSDNKFADMTNDEFFSKSSLPVPARGDLDHFESSAAIVGVGIDWPSVPDEVDWRKRGAVTPVKDQGSCRGADWAFLTVAALEGIVQITTGELEPFSEQMVIDCAKP